MKNNYKGKIAFFVAAVILFMCTAASASVLFSRMLPYSETDFVNIMPLLEPDSTSGIYAGVKYPEADGTAVSGDFSTTSAPAETDGEITSAERTEPSSPDASVSDQPATPNAPSGASGSVESARPDFRMEADVAIFKLSYDETGKITVIGAAGNKDNLIAPGTTNLYQFTLQNNGNVALDYTLTMEAYVTGTDLWIPVNARVWDYTNKYLVGSPDEMPDVMELNTVDERATLGAGKYAVYNLEWEWPFERADENGDITENDIYDTMLGNLAVDDELVLHIVIRTYAEYDEETDGPGIPPKTGDDSQILLFSLLCGGSFVGLCVMVFVVFKSGRKEKEKKAQ